MGNCLSLRGVNREQRRHEQQQQQFPPSVPHPPPTQHHTEPQTAEEQWNRLLKLMRIWEHLPREAYTVAVDGAKGEMLECVICCIDFTCGDSVRRLRCRHIYHGRCIDEWLMRSLTCPYCRDPVDEVWPATQTTD